MVPYQDTFAQGFNCASVQLEAAASHNVNIDMMPIADLDVTAILASSRLPKLKPKAKAKAKQNADAGKRAKRNKKPQSRKPKTNQEDFAEEILSLLVQERQKRTCLQWRKQLPTDPRQKRHNRLLQIHQ